MDTLFSFDEELSSDKIIQFPGLSDIKDKKSIQNEYESYKIKPSYQYSVSPKMSNEVFWPPTPKNDLLLKLKSILNKFKDTQHNLPCQ